MNSAHEDKLYEILFKPMFNSLEHLLVLHKCFLEEDNTSEENEQDLKIYYENYEKLVEILNDLKIKEFLYSEKGRQMILADLYEYIFLGRGYYSMRSPEDRGKFIKAILRFVNILMCYDSLVASVYLRRKFNFLKN
jgi:hypothetical protein